LLVRPGARIPVGADTAEEVRPRRAEEASENFTNIDGQGARAEDRRVTRCCWATGC
jgi:hypothetical protein